MNEAFRSHRLSPDGAAAVLDIREEFDKLLTRFVEEFGLLATTREFALCRTKLEEACFFAVKAMASQPENQERPDAPTP